MYDMHAAFERLTRGAVCGETSELAVDMCNKAARHACSVRELPGCRMPAGTTASWGRAEHSPPTPAAEQHKRHSVKRVTKVPMVGPPRE